MNHKEELKEVIEEYRMAMTEMAQAMDRIGINVNRVRFARNGKGVCVNALIDYEEKEAKQ